MDLARGFDEVLEMSADEEIAEIDEFAVVFVFDVDNAPSVLATTDLLAIDDDRFLAANDSKWNHVFDCSVGSALLIVKLVIVVWVHSDVVEGEFLSDALLESSPLFQSQRIRLGDDWDYIDDIREFLEDDDIDGLEGMAGRLDEEETAVDACVLDIALSLSGEFLAEVCRVLVFDVLDDRVPAGSG